MCLHYDVRSKPPHLSRREPDEPLEPPLAPWAPHKGVRFAMQDAAVYMAEGYGVYGRMSRSCRRFQEATCKRGGKNPFQLHPGEYGFTTDISADYSEMNSTYPSFVGGDKYAFTVLRSVSRMLDSFDKASGVDSFTPPHARP